VKPEVIPDSPPVAPGRVEETACAVLDTMLTRPFRVGPLPAAEVRGQLLQRVRYHVARHQPVNVTVGYGPLKNPNAVAYSRADWAEFFALCHLVAWHNKVQAVYAPGLALHIAFDDTTLVMANHADKGLMHSYMESIGTLIGLLGFGQVLTATMRHSYFAWLFHFGLYQVANYLVRRWERDPAHRPQVERMDEAARRNLVIPPALSLSDQAECVRAASHRYRVYWEALQLSGVTRTKKRLIAMYLDGRQHHIPQQVALHLTSLDKGQVTQPWQGAGALIDNEHGKLEPTVLTRGRQERYHIRMVTGLDFGLGPDFEQIAVATANPGVPHEGADSAPGTAPVLTNKPA